MEEEMTSAVDSPVDEPPPRFNIFILLVPLAFGLGLLVGWQLWGRYAPAQAAESTSTAQSSTAAQVEQIKRGVHFHLEGVLEQGHDQDHQDRLRQTGLVLDSAGSWAAIAIGNALQHQRWQRQLRESQALAAIGRALNETLNLEQVLHLIVTSTRQLIPRTDQVVILIVDETTQVVFVMTEQGRTELRLTSGEELRNDPVIRVSAAGRVFRVDDFQTQEARRHWGVADSVRSLIAAPVRSGLLYFGVISAQSDEPNAFDADDERLLSTLGDEAAIAIHNARLYQSEHGCSVSSWAGDSPS